MPAGSVAEKTDAAYCPDMPHPYFDAPQFIIEGTPESVDITLTPYFYNNGGTPTYVATVPENVELLVAAPTNPDLARGYPHGVTGTVGVQTSSYGMETQLGFTGGKVAYEPLLATREVAEAFGITLVEPGQAIQVTCPHPQLDQIPYDYGVFAGHWSPYQGTGYALLSVVCTDLEHHDFPHVFASTDPLSPLVISVGRYWHATGEIRLADLWVPTGHALYIPPKPLLLDAPCIDLHNNRNSARACWGNIHKTGVATHTLLQTSDTYTYWYWNPLDTDHSPLR